jgi:molybdopterin-guanine dinucleotide biosynthesis protein A
MGASPKAPEAAVVLAGGLSSRMGRDKAAIEIGQTPLLARMVALARRFCPLVAVSGRDPSALVPGVPWFPDQTPGLGPIGGILTALDRFGKPCLVLSCDLPLLDEATLDRLLAAWRHRAPGTVMTTFLQRETGFIEALIAVYEPEAAPLLRKALAGGCRKLSRAIPPERRTCVDYSVKDGRPFFNVNTPKELAEAASALKGGAEQRGAARQS